MADKRKELASAERRNFLKLSATGGFTAAMVAGAAGTLWSDAAVAQTAQEERERENNAEHIMTLATAYVLGASRSYPIMQLDLKENIQNMTNGKVYVRLAPGGQLGAGGALAQAVQGGTIQCAQHSLSNFAPFASVVDLINLPYFCGSNQRFTNLTSAFQPEASRDLTNNLEVGKSILCNEANSTITWASGFTETRKEYDFSARQFKDRLVVDFPCTGKISTGYIRLADITFEEVLQAPKVRFADGRTTLKEGDIFIFRTRDGEHFGKLEVLEILEGNNAMERALADMARQPPE